MTVFDSRENQMEKPHLVFGSLKIYKEKPHLLRKETQQNPVALTQPHRPRSLQTYSLSNSALSQFVYFSFFFTPLLSTSTHHWQQEYRRQSGEIDIYIYIYIFFFKILILLLFR